jgi:hypothetical protein
MAHSPQLNCKELIIQLIIYPTISEAGDADLGPCSRTSFGLDEQWATTVTLHK